MPIININGGSGGPGKGPSPDRNPNGFRTGPTSQIPYMRPDYDKAFNSNNPPSKNGPDDYARAQAQKEAQQRRADAADRQKQAQVDASYRKSQQQADNARRIFERNTAAEVRAYESAERAKAKSDTDLQRVRERNARAQEQLDRRKAADAERLARFQRGYQYGDARHIDAARDRGFRFQRSQEYGDARAMDSLRTRRLREEVQLTRQFEGIRYRAGRTLTPSSYDGIQRQASLLRGRAAQYQSQYGMSPSGLGGLGGVMSSMGSQANTYATQNITGLGARGQRAAESREWTGLARIEQELRRIERVNIAMLANSTKATADQKANATRNLDAIRQSRARIGAGRSGSSGMMNAVGSAIGASGLLLSNPALDIAAAAAVGLATSPFLIAGAAQKVMGLAGPYDALREGTAGVGRAGGFNSTDLQNKLFPGGPAPRWMKDLGVTTQSALGTLGNYGISPRSSEEALGVVQDVRRASLSQFMGLDDKQLSSSGRLARTLGISGSGVHENSTWTGGGAGASTAESTYTTDLAKYFSTLQKVMASATAQGLDHATSLQTVEGLLRITAGAGAGSVNSGALSNFWGQMTSSGLPGMRSGEGVTSALQGINQAFGSIGVGGAPAQNTMMMSYFGRNGGMPKSEGALQKFLGMSDKDWAEAQSQPGHKQMVDNYLNASGKNPAFALSYLSPLLQGRPDLMQKVFEGSAFGGTNSLIKPMLGGVVTGAGYAGYVGMTSGKQGGLAAVGGAAPSSSADIDSAIRAAANATGLDPNLLKGLAAKESSLNPGAVNGNAAGLMQLMPDARKDMGLSDSDMLKPQENALAGAGYLKRMYGLFDEKDPDRTKHALEAYEWGPGHVDDIKAGRVPDIYSKHADLAMSYGAQYTNVPSDQFASRANTEAMGLTAAKDARDNAANLLGQSPGDAMATFSSAVVQGTTAMEGFIRALVDGSQAINNNSMRAAVPGGINAMDPNMMPFEIPGAGPARP